MGLIWLKEFIYHHKRLNYVVKFVRHVKDNVFIDIVTGYKRDPDTLHFVKHGDEMPDQYFYDIYLDYPSKGFFSLYNQTIDALKYANRFNLTPVVTWSNQCLYSEQHSINGVDNPFGYYFECVSDYCRDDIAHASHVLGYCDCQRWPDKDYPFSVLSKMIVENGAYNKYIDESAVICSQYIQLKQVIIDDIVKSKQQIGFGGRTLGVHVRMTDMKNKSYINHAVSVSVDEFIAAAKKEIARRDYDSIFLATDETGVISRFQSELNIKVIYCMDAYRSEDGKAVHFSDVEREDHKYRLGIEVIRDMVLLSECESLICMYSNVSISAQIMKKSRGDEYTYLGIIDKGFNKNGITTYKDHFDTKR